MTAVNTTAGPVDSADLGFTLMHEHVLFTTVSVRATWPDAFERDLAARRSIERLAEARRAGVDTIVDVTTMDFGRDAQFVAEVAAQADIQVVMCTGFWDVPRFFHWRPPDVAVELLVREIVEGIHGTNVRAGIIKVASPQAEISGPWDLAFRAAARAHRQTGVPITTHTDAWKRSGLDQQRVLAEEGVDLTRVVIGHCADADDVDYLKRLLDRGSCLSMDRFGMDYYIPDPRPLLTTEQRIGLIAALCRDGYADRLVLSHDANCFCDHRDMEWQDRTYPNWKFSYVPSTVVPALLEAGVSPSDVERMTRLNPRAVFERQSPY